MDNSKRRRKTARAARVMRVRKKVRGTAEKPRFSVLKTNMHLYAQLIDDEKGVTLAGFGTQSKGCREKRKSKTGAKEVGQQIAHLAKGKNINTVVFDRGRYKFHGLIAELANSAREAGLQF
ncbi:MAG: 50S ribosomal protein L18 [Verrucomicrobia bacterium]|nr:50S ribosomal protein L18 [Verrucomicrobiota bacterium]MBU6446030.1 50S ribosomal protein L18 [Verrucomicrobiota bacterium]MDE3046764.1 50S ribosomal protein L18 [Verrucomicrobiota bacterium]